jgi:N-acetylated-alpha-linked acidic dipeptidase
MKVVVRLEIKILSVDLPSIQQQNLVVMSNEDQPLIPQSAKDSDNQEQQISAVPSPKERELPFYSKAILAAATGILFVAIITILLVYINITREPDYVAELFLAVDPSHINESIRNLSAIPHIAGSPENYQTALYIQNKFLEFGIPNVRMESYPIMLTYPIERQVQLVYPSPGYTCVLQEASYQNIDGVSGDPRAVPPWNGWSASGNVTAELVYVNYGRIEDWMWLDSQNISVSGKIVIVRYGKIFRGDKCHMAEQRGAVGCLIYSDPQDDGYLRGPVYPYGPWRANTSVQRGSVWIGTGDPLTPGYPSTPNSPQLAWEDLFNATRMMGWPLPTIPIQPLSYSDAEPLLQALGGMPVPNSTWQGGFNFTYHVGPGPAIVNLRTVMNFTNTSTIYNVIGMIPGFQEPDRYVIVGGHRDAWTFGAEDPISGSAAILEVARSLGTIYQNGWRPRRTVVIISWDAEEYALIGSTEFTELHYQKLTSRAVAYLNVDIAVSGTGYFDPSGTPNLWRFLINTAARVHHMNNPQEKTVLDYWMMNPDSQSVGGPFLDTLDSGSDYGSFIQHVGVSSLHVQFTDYQGKYEGVYHSNYDNYYWVRMWGDPTFEFHATLARLLGLLVKELSDSLILPFNVGDYAQAILNYTIALEQAANQLPDKPSNLTFSYLKNAIYRLQNCSVNVTNLINSYNSSFQGIENLLQIRALNDKLMLMERSFIDYNGIPGRPWLRHMIYAISQYNGYSGIPLPTISDALFVRDWQRVQDQIKYVSLFVDAATENLCQDLF